MVDLVTDAQLFDAQALVQAKFAEAWELLVAMEVDLPPTDMIGLAECLNPSPEALVAECERLQRLYLAAFDDVPVDVELKVAEDDLDDWQGEAARAFKGRLTAIASVHEQQKTLLVKATLHAGALLGLTMAIRKSYLDLAGETVAALDAEMGNVDKRQAKAFIALGSDLVRDALAIDATKLLTGSISMMVGVAKNLADYLIDGNRYQEILEKYRTGCERIVGEYRSGLGRLTQEIQAQHDQMSTMTTGLEEPLPSTADFQSPNFDYRHFAHEDMPVSEYQPRVAQEKKRVADARESQESEINRRLDSQL